MLFYRGWKGARITFVILFGLGGIIALYFSFTKFGYSWAHIVLWILGLAYAGGAILLGSIKSVGKYQEFQRFKIAMARKMGKEN